MDDYRNISGNSTVRRYSQDERSITIQFQNGEVYEYTYASAGKRHVETMKLLAKAGWGLGTYIDQVTRYGYARQLQ